MKKKKTRKDKHWIKKGYQESFSTISKAKAPIYIGLGIFIASILIGFFFPVFFQEQIIELLKQIINTFEGKNLAETAVFIFLNNVKASFFAMILGLALGIFPIFVAIINGYLIGFVMRAVVDIGEAATLWQLLPHGIFELPAVIMSIGLGIYLGHVALKENKKKNNLKKEFLATLKTFIFVIVPLLIIAAIIEAILIFSLPSA